MEGWKLIETAPKSQDDMLLLLSAFNCAEDYDASITVGFWGPLDSWADSAKVGWCDWCAGLSPEDVWDEVNPTHWMPLPEPPE